MEITYEVKAVCQNCGTQSVIKIPVGVGTHDFFATHPCRYCGCFNLTLMWPKPKLEKMVRWGKIR